MKLRVSTALIAALLCLAPAATYADLAPYSQDFEALNQADPGALGNDPAPFPNGWLVFANVFRADWSYWYGYGVFPAPNGGPGFSAIAAGSPDPQQGSQWLVTYSDYNNGQHGDGSSAIIEANVFQEQTVGASDVGKTWVFNFDAKRGDIGGASMAAAFIKTLNPAAGYALTNFIKIDTHTIPDTWGSYSLSIFIDPSLEGQLLQIGFVNWASNYEPSGVFYDNIEFLLDVDLDIKPGSCPNPMIGTRSRAVLSAAVVGSATLDVNDIDITSLKLEGVAPIRSSYEDVTEPFAGDLCGCSAAGPDGLTDLTVKFRSKDLIQVLGSSPAGDRTLTLTGTLLDGTPFQGQDCVLILSGGGGKGRRPMMKKGNQ